ncbi:MAG: PH domain-containing protein [Halobacteriales archaeon]|nr:PH domain-containing protein [Halobacteriales archaeon]
MEALNPRIRNVWLFVAVVTAAVVGSVSGAVEVMRLDTDVPVTLIIATAVLVLLGVYQLLRYRNWGFEVQDDAVYIEHGVLVRVKKVVPFVRIQHIDSRRGPVERATGLATLVIYTAGSRGADVSIPGLTPERADELREKLRELAIENEESIEDAV